MNFSYIYQIHLKGTLWAYTYFFSFFIQMSWLLSSKNCEYFQMWTESELSRNNKKDDRLTDSLDIHLFWACISQTLTFSMLGAYSDWSGVKSKFTLLFSSKHFIFSQFLKWIFRNSIYGWPENLSPQTENIVSLISVLKTIDELMRTYLKLFNW